MVKKIISILGILLFCLTFISAANIYSDLNMRNNSIYNASKITTYTLNVTSGESITLAGATFSSEGFYTSIDTNWLAVVDRQPSAFLGIYAANESNDSYATLAAVNNIDDSIIMFKTGPNHPIKANSGVILNDGGEFDIFNKHTNNITFRRFTNFTTGASGEITNITNKTDHVIFHDVSGNYLLENLLGGITANGEVSGEDIRVKNLSIDQTLPGVYNNFNHVSRINDTYIQIYSDCANIRHSNGTIEKVCWEDINAQYVNVTDTLPWATFTWTNSSETEIEFGLLTYWPDTLQELEQYAIIGRLWRNDSNNLAVSGRHFMLANDPYVSRTTAWGNPAYNIDVFAQASSIDSNYIALSTGELFRWPINSYNSEHLFYFSGDTQITSMWGHLQNQSVHDTINTTGTNEFDITELSSWYDNNGATTAMPNNQFTVHLIGAYAASEVLVWFRGQTVYATLAEAEAAIGTDEFHIASWDSNSNQISKISWVIMKEGATDYTNSLEVKFVAYSTGGGAGSSGSGITTFAGLTDTPSSYVEDAIFYSGTSSVLSSSNFVYDDGYVGINTTTPTQALDVRGHVVINSTTAASTDPQLLVFSSNTSSYIRSQTNASGGHAMFSAKSDGNEYRLGVGMSDASNDVENDFFIYDGTIRFVIENGTGNVGIGASNPISKLEVNGDVNLNDTLYVDSSGNVGIGTSNPTVPFDVEMTSGVGGIQMGKAENTATGSYSLAVGEGTNASSTASVAMGVSTKASGYASLAINRDTTSSGSRSFASGYNTTAGGAYSATFGERTQTTGVNAIAMGENIIAGADGVVAIGLADMSGANCNQANSMCIMGGNVGIGTSSPTQKLSIAGGTSNYIDITGSTNAGIHFISPDDNNWSIYKSGGGHFRIRDESRDVDVVNVAPTTGNFGIGTSSPSEHLHVYGSEAQRIQLESSDANATTLRLKNTDETFNIYNVNSRLYVKNAASVGVYLASGDTSWTADSDSRLKENITSLDESVLDKVLALNPVNYNWKNENASQDLQVGFIAQEVLEAGLDEVVTIPEDIENDYYGLQYSMFVPYLTKAIQELKSEKDLEIEELKLENDAMKQVICEELGRMC